MREIDSRITCPRCRVKEQTAINLGLRVQDLYWYNGATFGMPCKPDMGHQHYFHSEGRIALCIADRRPPKAGA